MLDIWPTDKILCVWVVNGFVLYMYINIYSNHNGLCLDSSGTGRKQAIPLVACLSVSFGNLTQRTVTGLVTSLEYMLGPNCHRCFFWVGRRK